MCFKNKNIAIMGLGKSGLDVASRLVDSGAHVYGWDDSTDSRNNAKARNIPLVDLSRVDIWDSTNFDMFILSPGIPHHLPKPHPSAIHAQNHNVPILGEVALLAMIKPHAHYIGITGTNGKSTTTALIEHCLQQANISAQAGGNLAIPALGLPDADVYVLEISSYMAERLNGTKFNTAILMNLSPDHLDRHGDMDGYLQAKLKMFDGCDNTCTAIVVIDDDYTKSAYEILSKRSIKTIAISATQKCVGGIYMDGDRIIDDRDNTQSVVCTLQDIDNLVGQHNQQNIMAVYACLTTPHLKNQGMNKNIIIPALKTFTSLPHRQQFVARIGTVQFINDSKATNMESAIRGINSYKNVYWIAGGESKESAYHKITPSLPYISKGYFIGDAQDDLADFFADTRTPFEKCGTLDVAVHHAYADAMQSGHEAVVLLSPACASWDQFDGFDKRGDAFINAVKSLPQHTNTDVKKGKS